MFSLGLIERVYRLKKPRKCNNANIRNNYPVSEIIQNKFAGTAAKDEALQETFKAISVRWDGNYKIYPLHLSHLNENFL